MLTHKSVILKRVKTDEGVSTTTIAKCNVTITGSVLAYYWRDVNCKECRMRKKAPNKIARAVRRIKDDIAKRSEKP